MELVLVMPATNSTSERCFSKLRLILTNLGTRMSNKEEIDSLVIVGIAKDFVLRNPIPENIFAVPKTNASSKVPKCFGTFKSIP